jgi:hypothetical protein
MPRFTCAECGKGVVVVEGGEVLRHCEHKDAVVHANLKAILYSHGELEARENH